MDCLDRFGHQLKTDCQCIQIGRFIGVFILRHKNGGRIDLDGQRVRHGRCDNRFKIARCVEFLQDESLQVILQSAWPAIAAWILINAVMSALQVAVVYAPFSAAYRDMKGGASEA